MKKINGKKLNNALRQQVPTLDLRKPAAKMLALITTLARAQGVETTTTTATLNGYDWSIKYKGTTYLIQVSEIVTAQERNLLDNFS